MQDGELPLQMSVDPASSFLVQRDGARLQVPTHPPASGSGRRGMSGRWWTTAFYKFSLSPSGRSPSFPDKSSSRFRPCSDGVCWVGDGGAQEILRKWKTKMICVTPHLGSLHSCCLHYNIRGEKSQIKQSMSCYESGLCSSENPVWKAGHGLLVDL